MEVFLFGRCSFFSLERKSSSEFDGEHSDRVRFPITNSQDEESFMTRALIRLLCFVLLYASWRAEFFTECMLLPKASFSAK